MARRSPALLLCLLLLLVAAASVDAKAKAKAAAAKADPHDNKGNTPFFLQDPYDQQCLGPGGFTVCDERALWVLTRRVGKKTYSLVSLLNPTQNVCLQRKSGFGPFSSDKVGMGPCNAGGSKAWEFVFVDDKHVKISTKGQCLVRGKKTYKNSVSVQPCSKTRGAAADFLPLIYHPTAVHEAGFYLKSADGACFDGSAFRSCEGQGSKSLLWGVGIRYSWDKASRYFFNFNPTERNLCIVGSGKTVSKGECSKRGSQGWGLRDGQLSTQNGHTCVVRLPNDNAALAPCTEASEYITMEVPTSYTQEELTDMMRNQDKLSPEERQKLAQAVKQYEMSGAKR